MEYSNLDIEKKFKLKKQNIKRLRESILQEGMDFYFIQTGKKKIYKYKKSALRKLERINRYKK